MTDASWVPIPPGSPFPVTKLPLGVGHTRVGRRRAWVAVAEDQPLEIVTGNNDADAVYFLNWARRHFDAGVVSSILAHASRPDHCRRVSRR